MTFGESISFWLAKTVAELIAGLGFVLLWMVVCGGFLLAIYLLDKWRRGR